MEKGKFEAMLELNKHKNWSSLYGKGEIKMLREILDEDEELLCLVQGQFKPEMQQGHGRMGISAATSKRIIFLDKGVWGSTETAEMQYDKVTSVTHSTGMMFGGIRINGFGNSGFQIESVPKDQTNEFADIVRQMNDQSKQKDVDTDSSRHEETMAMMRLQLDELREIKDFLAKPCGCGK